MSDQPSQLYWRDQLIGHVCDIVKREYPWHEGRVQIVLMSAEMRQALEYLHEQWQRGEGVADWPYSDEFEADWQIVHADGSGTEICEPVIDFALGTIRYG